MSEGGEPVSWAHRSNTERTVWSKLSPYVLAAAEDGEVQVV